MYPIRPWTKVNKIPFAYWENFLTPEDMHNILTHPNWGYLQDGQVGGYNDSGAVMTETRRSKISWYAPDDKTRGVYEKIELTIREVNRQFFNFDLTAMYEPAQLGFYSEKDQGHYTWHIDAGAGPVMPPRKLTMVLQLNDPSEFSGGELQIMYDRIDPVSLELKRGRAWFFPSYMLHRVTPVTRGERKSLVLWIGGPEFK